MSETVIEAENLSKLYRLGQIATGTLSQDLNRWWNRARGREDPYLKVGQINDRARGHKSGYVWALKDINFTVKHGEALGIIGRNGAGKSTLLKILSRVTAPTSGRIRVRGRIASLLEVGTGFHPELTGRENIFLNGAILGMQRHEITKKLDEIVEFSGCAAYIDTPVKRYSSGMTVRLAFAVAAFLDAEILVIDEVLAVGDWEFQKKCMGQIDTAAKAGRTVLFVSHNMGMISSLCHRALVINQGSVAYEGSVADSILAYYSSNKSNPYEVEFEPDSSKEASLLYAAVLNESNQPTPEVSINDGIRVRMDFCIRGNTARSVLPSVRIHDSTGTCVFTSSPQTSMAETAPGTLRTVCHVPRHLLNDGTYFITLAMAFMENGARIAFFEKDALSVNVRDPIEETIFLERQGWAGPIPGVVRPLLDWSVARDPEPAEPRME